GEEEVRGVAEDHAQRRVEHVRGGHPEVKPPRGGADALLHEGEERDDVVTGGALDLVDPGGVSVVEVTGAGPTLGQRIRGGDARLHPALERGESHATRAHETA